MKSHICLQFPWLAVFLWYLLLLSGGIFEASQNVMVCHREEGWHCGYFRGELALIYRSKCRCSFLLLGGLGLCVGLVIDTGSHQCFYPWKFHDPLLSRFQFSFLSSDVHLSTCSCVNSKKQWSWSNKACKIYWMHPHQFGI